MKLLILSDLHANWPALSAVLHAEPGYDGIICLGDTVNYGPHPLRCLEWVRTHALPGWTAQGNHDYALAHDADPRCSVPFAPLARAMQNYTAGKLDADARAWLGCLPPRCEHVLAGQRVHFCHATPSNPLYAYLQPEQHAAWEEQCSLAAFPDFLLVGHTHLPFIAHFGRTTVVNPGSVGQPKDGDPRAAYALWQDGQIKLRRIAYDVASVTRDLAA